MNFFEHQALARRKSGLLLVYFVVAVALIVLAVNLVVWYGLRGVIGPQPFLQWSFSPNGWKTAVVTLSIIAAGSLATWWRLRSGGEAVARMVGATPVDLQSRDERVRRYINVVEEMAIAAGVVMPRLYVMEREAAINAFVAGYQPNQAVMVVTRGTLDHLNRDELQGVVGHEFSHILNGDMRLNVRLLAVLAGILSLGQIGEFLLRSTRHASRSRDSGKAVPVLAIAGLGLMLVGYIGLFFGRLIKAAVSRQREFLADASAVQFTRNPQGLASALYRIKTMSDGSLLSSTLHAEDLNHMAFGETTALRLQSLFASHPPLDERIKSVDPMFMPKARLQRNRERLAGQPATVHPLSEMALGLATAGSPLVGEVASAMGASAPARPLDSIEYQSPVSQVGVVRPEHYDYAVRLRQSWPDELRDWVHSPAGAVLVVAAVLMTDLGKEEQGQALRLLVERALPLDLPQTDIERVGALVSELKVPARLPLVELCLASLKQLEPARRDAFLELVTELIRLDQRYTLFEFVVATLLRKQLATGAGKARPVRVHSFKPVLADIQKLIAVLARCGHDERADVIQVFEQAMRPFTGEPLAAPERCSLAELNRALGRLAALSPMLKAPLLQACADVVLQDGLVKPAEYELLRAVAEVLDCPMPPLVNP